MSILFNRVTVVALIYCTLQDIVVLFLLNKGIGLHGGLLYTTNILQVFHIFIYIISIFILQLTSFSSRQLWTWEQGEYFPWKILKVSKITNNMGDHLKIIEYPLILLFIISGAIFLISTYDLVSIFLSIELQSYGLYLLSTIYRNSEFSTTGGLIYFLLGGLSSCFILLGTSLLYINSGTTNMEGLYIINNIDDMNNNMISWYKSYYINFSLFIFSIGFLFKISAAPFHFWSPDVYDAIPTIVTTFVAIIAKLSILILLLELVYHTNNYQLEFNWVYSLLISSFLSLILGTIVGLTQFRIKRLLAYSTISHLGFILLSLSISSVESIQAFLFYLIQYSISNLNAFIILIGIGYSLYSYISTNKEYENVSDKNHSPIQLINQLRGYFYINHTLSLSLAITIYSFIGIPPLMGFFAKQMVLSAALDSGYIFLSLIAILTSVIGAVYYLNIIREIYFFSSEHKTNLETESYIKKTTISSPLAISISIITLIIILFIFINKEWLSMGTILVQILFNS
jgi:NADH-ubiquinone oxidoreductase chain 2